MTAPILSIIGKAKSGKTTLLEKLFPLLKEQGYKVGTIKHHSHPGFEIDFPGKDTWRHAQAGSDHVIIVAPVKMASIKTLQVPLTIDEIAEMMTGVDIILTDGFKSAGKPAIEVMRAESGLIMIGDLGQVLAVATDTPLDLPVPQIDINDIAGILALIQAYFFRN
jgi:molybdopterin-guanine dinucleotide biosynthesis protein B